MEASDFSSAARGPFAGQRGWQSRPARTLHNRVGYALRDSKPWARMAPSWREGAVLMAGLLEWTRRWDSDLSRSSLDAMEDRAPTLGQCEGLQDGAAHGRRLRQHDSGTSTNVPETGEDDDGDSASVVSIATTATWDLGSHGQSHVSGSRSLRKPRCRPGRRTRRKERQAEFDALGARLHRQGQDEVELENGRMPLPFLRTMADSLLTIAEEDDEGV